MEENTIEIRSIDGNVIFTHTQPDNTLKKTLKEAVGQGVSLRRAVLTECDLSYIDLYEADLREACLVGANLYRAHLKTANLSKANLSGANIYNTTLSGANLHKANLSGANISGSNLCGTDLSEANLYRANIKAVDLNKANLRKAELENAVLCRTCFYNTDIREADFSGADLYRVNFGTNLQGTVLDGANINWANLYGSNPESFIPMACPSDGSFIGWKKIKKYKDYYLGEYIVKLEIPEDAKRSSATTNKCRCDKAKVLEIANIKTGEKVDCITNTSEKECVYKVGEMVYPDSFDEDRWNECSHGIHFFINRQEAIEY